MRWLTSMFVIAAVSSAAHEAPPLIALDVGHFLARPGAVSARGRTEFEFNRELASAIRSSLEAYGARVQLIGADGELAVLAQRTAAARGASLFLSVHHDSVQPSYLVEWQYAGTVQRYSDRFAGFSLFVSRRNAWSAASLACASAIGRALRAAGFTPSLYHADAIPGEGKPFADRPNGVHYYDDLVVLRTATQPAVLLEAGVIVNRDEELALRLPATQRRIADAVAAGVQACRVGGEL